MSPERSLFIYKQMVINSIHLFGNIDRNGYFQFVSGACKKILGYESSELKGKHYSDLLHPNDYISTGNVIQEAIESGMLANFSNRYIHKDGQVVFIDWSGVWSEGDGTLYCVGRDITEQQEKKAYFEESEQRYKALFNNSPDILFVENRKGLITEANQRFKEIFEVNEDQIINFPASSFLPSKAASINKKNLKQALLGNSMRFDLKLGKGRKARIFDTSKHPVIVRNEVVGVYTIARDITPIVRSYKFIDLQAKKLSKIFESITDAFFALDSNWRFTYVNSKFAKLEGYEKDEMLGQNIWELFPKLVSSVFYQNCHESLKSGVASYFEEDFDHSGVTYRFKIYPSPEGLSVYFTDVTKEKVMQQELEKLSLVASKTTNGVVIIDRDRKIEWVNEGFTKMTGYTLMESVGKRPIELLAHEQTDNATLNSARNQIINGESVTYEVLNRTKSGHDLWLSIETNPIYGKDKEITGFVTIQTDITALKESELSLSRSAKDLYRHNKDLQQFTYIVSHNLRAPVANAVGLANLLTKLDKGTELYDTALSNLNQSVTNLDIVLRDVNTILSIRDSKLYLEQEQVNLSHVLQQVLSSIQEKLHECGGKVFVDIPEGLSIKTNKAYIYSVFYNLLSNAIKYRAEGRELEVQVTCMVNNKNETAISFSDNGSGFDMKKAKGKIFNLYKRFHKDKEGRGIGLYLVKSHIEAMNGHVEVSSQLGEGSKFSIYLPILQHENIYH